MARTCDYRSGAGHGSGTTNQGRILAAKGLRAPNNDFCQPVDRFGGAERLGRRRTMINRQCQDPR
jgi:hypothetical protein